MSGASKRYLFDTNIFIYYFNGEPILKPLFDEVFSGQSVVLYCPISWVELLCYPALTTDEAEQIRDFLRRFEQVDLPEAILDKAAQIRMDYRTALPDAIIAACAITTESILVTRNEDDFNRISDLAICNPFT
ncbi:MAG: type II toxin-antitoxin system VapC family toxin [Leptolyngbya sp. SIOISBB]|nr:type II toxin-antitoxin system VapC family toxin [Leptolyngbya sp. SIOISBB]